MLSHSARIGEVKKILRSVSRRKEGNGQVWGNLTLENSHSAIAFNRKDSFNLDLIYFSLKDIIIIGPDKMNPGNELVTGIS